MTTSTPPVAAPSATPEVPVTGIGAGAAALALNPQTAPSVPSTMVPPEPTIVPGPPPTQAPQPPVDPNSWTASLSDASRVFLERKAIKDMETAIKGYSEVEKFIGVPGDKLIKLPEDTDTEGWNNVFAKLGRPEKPEDYGINLGDTPEAKAFVDWATKTFHENGLTKKAAAGIMEKYAEYAKGETVRTEMEAKARVESDTLAIKQEWGAAYDQNLNAAKEFAAKSGIEPAQIDAMEKSIGFAATLKFFAGLGQKLGEHNFVSGGTVETDGTLSPQAAREELDSLGLDFINKLTAGDPATIKRFDQLNRNLIGKR
jgi:hypothetical protein